MIKEINYNKYLVLKIEDLDKYFNQFTSGIFTTDEEAKYIDTIPFTTVLKEVEKIRETDKKPKNNYLVLNINDEFDIRYLFQQFKLRIEQFRFSNKKIKISNITVDIINSILKLQS